MNLNILFETVSIFLDNHVTLLSSTWYRINKTISVLTFLDHHLGKKVAPYSITTVGTQLISVSWQSVRM